MRQFSSPHLAALAVLSAGIAVSIWIARRFPGRPTNYFARGLGVVILAGWVGEYVADAVLGIWSVKYTLPLQLTDAVSLVSILALWTFDQLLVELTYFWSLTASLQAALTPDLGKTFPNVFYFTYFTYHVGAIVAGCFLVFGCRRHPRPGAVWRVFGITLGFTIIAAAADLLTGGNYMYLREKPVHSSLLSVMGPWPWYIAATSGLGLVLLLLVDRLTSLAKPRT
jgi:hypothetical integral membrane protein (TIGR02206 family)